MANPDPRMAQTAAYDGPTGPSLSSLSAGPRNLSDLIEAAGKVESHYTAFASRLSRLDNQVAANKESVAAKLATMSTLSRDQREKQTREESAAWRCNLIKASSDERYAALKELKALGDSVSRVGPLYESPAGMLMAEGLGSEDRSRYLDQLRHSGPNEVRTMALRAANTGNRLLAAAILSKLDSMPKADARATGISRGELADAVIGDDWRKANEALRVVRNRVQEALNRNRDFESGRPNGVARVGDALARHRETGALAAEQGD